MLRLTTGETGRYHHELTPAREHDAMRDKIERVVGVACISAVIACVVFWLADPYIASLLSHLSHRPAAQYHKNVYFEPRPFVMFGGSHDPEIQRESGLNSLGYRGPIPIMPKPPGEARVAVLGGSTVLNGTKPLPERLEQHFREAGRNDVRLYNFGVAAGTLKMDVARWVFEVSSYQPE